MQSVILHHLCLLKSIQHDVAPWNQGHGCVREVEGKGRCCDWYDFKFLGSKSGHTACSTVCIH